MGLYDRNRGKPGAKKNLWISFTITEDQRTRFGLATRTVREPSPENNERVAKALFAQRNREVREDSWRPASQGGGKSGVTVRQYALGWLDKRERAGVRSVRNERARLTLHALPVLGDKRMVEVRRQDVLDLIDAFATTPSKKTGEPPAPRMVHRVYEDLRSMFAQALEVDEIVPATPCTLRVKRGELPKKKDADPRWRHTAVFTRTEVERLISDERIDLPRRMTYALMFLTGARVGEVSGARWVDYDPTAKPLGRLVIATQYGGEATKTQTTREVPVHPALAAMLAEWKLRGFAYWHHRTPAADDHIVPRLVKRGRKAPTPYQCDRRVWEYLQADLDLLGIRRRRVHDSRRTMITLARSDGADRDMLRWITHGPSADMMDVYSSPPWQTLCAQISCLRIVPAECSVVPLRPAASTTFR